MRRDRFHLFAIGLRGIVMQSNTSRRAATNAANAARNAGMFVVQWGR